MQSPAFDKRWITHHIQLRLRGEARLSLAFGRRVCVNSVVISRVPAPLRSSYPFLFRLSVVVVAFAFGFSGCAPRSSDVDAEVLSPSDERAIIAAVVPAVVRIEAVRLSPRQGRMVKASVTGSGVIVSDKGHVATNYHVADNAEHFICHLNDGTQLPARRIGQDALTDLAVLQLDLSERSTSAGPLPVASFGNSDGLQTGDTVFAVGSPASLSQAVTRGVVSNPSLVLPDEIKIVLDGENVGLLVRWILHDASIFPGNSGGPLVNGSGEIIGINEIGVARLGGAIPSSVAKSVVERLIDGGQIVRGWSGIIAQPRLMQDAEAPGVLVSDVAAGSAAEQAGIKAGDVIVACGGSEIAVRGVAAVAAFYRSETACAPGETLAVALQAGEVRRSVDLVLTQREPAQHADIELRAWGAVFRDITQQLAREQRLDQSSGAWIENVRPGGAAGQAEPELKRGDTIISVDGRDVRDVSELRSMTDQWITTDEVSRTVLARVRRSGAELASVVELRLTTERTPTPQARRAWLGVAVQPLTAKLAARLAVNVESGARVTDVYIGTRAFDAGLLVGDIVLAVDDAPVTARRAEDTDVFARQIRQYRPDTDVKLAVWRDGARIDLPVVLERQPIPPAEMPIFVDERIEFTVREIAFDDRVRLRLAPGESGVLVDGVVASGWAALAGVKAEDILLAADGAPVADLPAFRAARDAAIAGDRPWWILQLKRAGQTLFVEINLVPVRS